MILFFFFSFLVVIHRILALFGVAELAMIPLR